MFDWQAILWSILAGAGVATVIILLAQKARSNVLQGSENVIQGISAIVEDTPFAQKYGYVMDIIADLVHGAEQLKKAGKIDSKQAKEQVKEATKEVLKRMNMEIDDRVLDLMIESAVFITNMIVKNDKKGPPKEAS